MVQKVFRYNTIKSAQLTVETQTDRNSKVISRSSC